MSEPDNSLIAEFNARRSEEAFAALVRQHVNLVFATAFRQVGDAGAAEEITQNVFMTLAQAAGRLGSHPTIAGWLHQTALNKSREWLRSELRRRKREQVAVNLQKARAEGDSVWSSLVPLLDEALLELRDADRLAVILHFLEGRNFQEVGSVLGVGEDAARKRVDRCLGQLTHFFRRQGFATPALTAGAPLFALSSHAVPAGLAASATSAGLAAHSTTSTLTLIKGALKIMAWTKAKTAIVVGITVLLTATTGTIVIKAINRSLSKLETRAFKTDRTFVANLQEVTGTSSAESVSQIASNYFVSKGIDFRPPKSIAYNDDQSLLFVKATAFDLNAIEKIIRQLTYAPPQVHSKAYFIKVPESDVESILKAGTVVDTKEKNMVEIMSPAQTSFLLRGLRSTGAMTLSEPEVLTTSGRQTQMSVGDTMVDLVSTVFDDGYTLKMTVIVSTPENLFANVNIWDEQTIVLAPNNSNDGKTRLLVLVTTTLVDQAGNKFHSDTPPFKRTAIPSQ